MKVSNLWQNAVLFFPGDSIPDPLPHDFLYLFVSGTYCGDFHNRYTAVKNMLEHADGNRVHSSMRNQFYWEHTNDGELDKLFSRGVNVLRDTPGFGPVLYGNRVHGSLLRPVELHVFGEVLRNIRLTIGAMWNIFDSYFDLPDTGSKILQDRIHSAAAEVLMRARLDHNIRKDDGNITTFDKLYGLAVNIGCENFLITSDFAERSVQVSVTPSFMALLTNVIGLDNIGTGDIVVDDRRVGTSMLATMIREERPHVVKYEFKVLE